MSSTKNNKNNNKKYSSVPFFVLNLEEEEEGKTKALFTVPSHLAETLIQHPVLCRGGAFDLRLDTTTNNNDNNNQQDESASTCFLSTEFHSPSPEATALEISERLASRVNDSCESPLSTIFGF